MSRETDSSSTGPQGRGGAAYPSGTPPYGTRQSPEDAVSPAAAAAPQPEEPRTETTLTTRIRINIPGSRPIPPVVMRTPMGQSDLSDAPDPERTGSTPRPREPEPEPVAEEPVAERPTSDWFAPRKPAAAAAPATAAEPADPGTTGDGRRPGLPYFSEPPQRGSGAVGAGPTGPTTGPVLGTGSLKPPLETRPTGSSGAVPPPMSDDTAVLTPQPPAPGFPSAAEGFPSATDGFSPTADGMPAAGYPGPQTPAGELDEDGPFGPTGGHVSGHTLNSGIPVVPPERRAPFPPGPAAGPGPRGSDGPSPYPPSPSPTPAAAPSPGPAAVRPATPGRKGRSKLGMAGVGLVVLAGIAYGAGLLMNHSDVPKGTTVLGVDIGGGTRDEAVNKLDSALGKRVNAPIPLSVDGRKTELKPAAAGLSLETQATVRQAAGSDYNPVSVIGSLFGGERVIDPILPTDQEKLSAALSDLAGGSGSASEGTIKFEPGKAVAVPGKAGKGLDVSRSMVAVRDAYRTQVQTGTAHTVVLPVVTRQPTISQTEIDRAMKEFAKPAMSGLITIKAGPKQIQFGPERSLPKILSMTAVDGRLVEVYNKPAITQLLDGVFDGIMITKGDGKKHQVSADDVAHAMQSALLGTTPAERTATIDLNPS
ncbi:hypothetical protein AB0436_16165 [Streptomyces sp. NPDC051322]|uniref:hypothetical protein n=1 Tax=Streptomyces sp. NPDC051322 TaxID=3154645 RepID=UPI00344D4DC6